MASTRMGRSSGVLSRLLSAGREGEKETGGSTREDQERGSGLVWKGIRGGAGVARDEHAGLVLVRRRWGATSLLCSKKVRCSKVAGRGLSFFFSFSDFASSFLFLPNSFGDKKG
jgi:hypothetical protein